MEKIYNMKKFYLFLDESGNFKDDDIDKSPSLVGGVLFEKDLPETVALDYLGEIQVSAKRVTIKPRKNAYTTQNKPMVFDY